MDRGSFSKKFLAELMSHQQRVVILRGGARSGKTTAVLQLYRSYLNEAGSPRCLLIAPNKHAVADLKRRALADSPTGIVLSPQVMTFATLARRILSASGKPGLMLSPARRHLLLRRIVDRLNRDGRLAALGAVAHTGGLIVALDRAIHELKRAAVDPRLLGRAIGESAGKMGDLLEIYTHYQQRLHETGRYDIEGMMWEARDCLANANAETPPPLGRIEAVAVDGFTDFTPTQLEILRQLSARVQRVLITLTYAAEDGRDRMWHWTARTLDQIRTSFADQLAQIDLGPASDTTPLGPLWEKLFDPDAAPVQPNQQVRVIAAAGIDAEVAAVARRVKRALVDKTPPGRIAIIARTLDAYREPIQRIFATHEIPIAPTAQPLTDAPIVRFALQAAALSPNFAFQDVLGVIKNSYFRPESLGPFGAETAATAEMLIRSENVLDGRKAYALAAERLARKGETAQQLRDDDEPVAPPSPLAVPDTIRAAGQMLEALFEVTTRATDGAGLANLIEQLQLQSAARQGDEPWRAARDLRALAALQTTLDELSADAPRLGELAEALAEATYPPQGHESLVDVLDVLDARSGRWDHVFLVGASEGQFPRRFSGRSLISEADRTALAARGVVLDNRGDLSAREMLLFYLAASRPEVTLHVSYQRWSGSGQDSAPGSFLLSLADALGGMDELSARGLVTTIGPGQFLPPAGDIATRQDALLTGLAGLFERQLDPDGAAICWTVRSAPGLLRRTAEGIWAHRRRWSWKACDAFDGLITHPALLEQLAAKFGPSAVFTATELNSYGQCPWWFFARYVLGLAPQDEPTRRLEPVLLGAFCHNVLFSLMQQLAQDSGRPVRIAQLDEQQLDTALSDAIEAQSDQLQARRQLPYPGLWSIQRRHIHRQLLSYLLAQRKDKDNLDPQCLHFELRFGASRRREDLCDPGSTDEPIRLPTPAGTIQLVGRIDRIDQVHTDEGDGLMIVDYKSGRLPSQRDIDAGRSLQLPVYAEAAEQILCEPGLGGAFHGLRDGSRRYFAKIKKPRKGQLTYEQRKEAAAETIGRFVAAMRAGKFDLAPTDKCPGFCPYRHICHYTASRAQLKARAAQEDSS